MSIFHILAGISARPTGCFTDLFDQQPFQVVDVSIGKSGVDSVISADIG